MTRFDHIQDMFQSPQPAFNFDSIAPTDPAWFVATATATELGVSSSDVSALEGVAYRTLTWSGNTATLSATTVVPTPAYSAPINSPQLGVNNTVGTNEIDANDDRLLTAFIRNDQLWTVRTVGVNSSGAAGTTTAPADRDAAEVVELGLGTTSGTPSVQSGLEYDTATSNPVSYYLPSLMVNGAGYMVMSFTGSSSNEYAGVYSTSLLPTQALDTLPQQPVTLLKAGEDPYVLLDSNGQNRWGDYSWTTLDPSDGMTMWTVQEYAAATVSLNPNTNPSRWGTWITPVEQGVSMAVNSSANPIKVNTTLTLTALARNLAPYSPPATGTVSFMENEVAMWTANNATIYGRVADLPGPCCGRCCHWD